MLTILAYTMIVVFMALIMTKRLSAMVALILVPIVFGLIGGFGMGLGPMMLDGIKKLAPTGVMLMFAILYFGIMIDAGLFDPVVKLVLRLVGGSPTKIVVGTFLLAAGVSLDGDGSTTYMITCAAMLPLYQRLGMNRLVLACVVVGTLPAWATSMVRSSAMSSWAMTRRMCGSSSTSSTRTGFSTWPVKIGRAHV